jgi:hypothetical protein
MSNQPDDATLTALTRHVVETAAIGGVVTHAIHLIDKAYEVITVPRSTDGNEELVLHRVNRLRQQMLASGDLLAVVMTGWSGGLDGEAVCEYYPGPGQTETYTMAYPRPRGIWTDPDQPESKDSIQAYKDLWSIDRL